MFWTFRGYLDGGLSFSGNSWEPEFVHSPPACLPLASHGQQVLSTEGGADLLHISRIASIFMLVVYGQSARGPGELRHRFSSEHRSYKDLYFWVL